MRSSSHNGSNIFESDLLNDDGTDKKESVRVDIGADRISDSSTNNFKHPINIVNYSETSSSSIHRINDNEISNSTLTVRTDDDYADISLSDADNDLRQRYATNIPWKRTSSGFASKYMTRMGYKDGKV